MKILAFRLTTGQDLRKEIERAATISGFTSAFVLTCVGGLSAAYLRMPGAQDYLEIFEELEIVSLTGTIAASGCHFHGSFSDAQGRVIGGHVAEGCVVRLTAEVVIGMDENLTFRRTFDHDTKFAELQVDRKSNLD